MPSHDYFQKAIHFHGIDYVYCLLCSSSRLQVICLFTLAVGLFLSLRSYRFWVIRYLMTPRLPSRFWLHQLDESPYYFTILFRLILSCLFILFLDTIIIPPFLAWCGLFIAFTLSLLSFSFLYTDIRLHVFIVIYWHRCYWGFISISTH